MLLEPNPTPYDVRFSLLGIPVRIHPWFWVVAVLMGAGADTGAREILVWTLVVFVSILIHELGHACLARLWGSESWIVLYGFGGLAVHQPAIRDWRRRVATSLAGPAAGFLFAGLVIGLVLAAGHSVVWRIGGGSGFAVLPLLEGANPALQLAIFELLFVNFWWGLINLLPVYPLDGGQIARELCLRFARRDGLRRSLWISAVVAAAAAVYALTVLRSYFLLLLFGYLAYASYMALQHGAHELGDYDTR